MPPTEIPLNPTVLAPDGTVVTRKYELIEELGRGGAGTVWRARAVATGREYAIKILHEEGRGAPKAVARFLQERGILLRLRHENLVAVHDLLTTVDGRLALVLDLVTGGTLRDLLRQRGTLPPETAAELLAQVADGLTLAHGNGVVHRDLKPDNILLALTLDGGVRVRLTDFGIARVLDEPGMTTSGAVLGTPNYMAPEVIEGVPATPAADVYALGIILYELLAGRAPFDDDGCDTAILLRHTRAAARPLAGMPPRVWALIEACLHREPTQRPAAATLSSTLRRLAEETAGVAAIPPIHKGDASRPTFLLADTGAGPAARRRHATPAPRRTLTPAPPRALTPEPTPAPVPTPPRESTAAPNPPAGAIEDAAPRPEVPAQRRRRVTTAVALLVAVVLAGAGFAGMRTYQADRAGSASPHRHHTATAAPGRPATAGANPADPAPSGAAGPTGGSAAPSAGASGMPAPAPGGGGGNTAPPAGRPEDLGDWVCTEERWPVGHPVVGQACHAIGSVVRVKGVFSGISGVRANIEVSVENVDTGSTAAGPFRCAGRRFSDEAPTQTCGPYTVSLPVGRYRVVGRWTYYDVDSVTPPGEVVGNPFDW